MSVLGIDASRNRSGGAKAHLIGILEAADPRACGITEVHVWSYRELLDALPSRPWLVKHNPRSLEGSLPKQLWWQATRLSTEATQCGCDVLFATDASTLCRFRPMVVLSQDLLSYEPGVLRHYRPGYTLLRALTILYVQNAAFRRAAGVIFLTQYAGDLVQKSCGPLKNISYIPHGISDDFRAITLSSEWPGDIGRVVRIVYVSPIWQFKHQWVVVQAVELLRKRGHNVVLELVGDGNPDAEAILDMQVKKSDPNGEFVIRTAAVPYREMPDILAGADIFVFASSCENLPNTLLEAMAAGLPIACSDRGPMPEVLGDGGVYFDPKNPSTIARSIENLLSDSTLRKLVSSNAKCRAQQYSWRRTAEATFNFISLVTTIAGNRVSMG